MKRFDQWQFPDHEEHLQKWMEGVNMRLYDRLTYQGSKYVFSSKLCKQKRVAIDVGAHIGLWSYLMANEFERVICFEPMKAHIECWKENMKNMANAKLHECALGEEAGFVDLQTYTPDSSGDTRVVPGITGKTPMFSLDELLPNMAVESVDYIKIDCEGYELFILRGARETLLKYKPVVVVEQKGSMIEIYGAEKLAAVDFLKELGAVQLGAEGGDYFMGWPDSEAE